MASEFDYTAAVEEASRAWWNEHGHVQVDGEETPVVWELVPDVVKAQVRTVLLEAVVAAVDVALQQVEFEKMMGNGIED